jgi:hypothetical protein
MSNRSLRSSFRKFDAIRFLGFSVLLHCSSDPVLITNFLREGGRNFFLQKKKEVPEKKKFAIKAGSLEQWSKTDKPSFQPKLQKAKPSQCLNIITRGKAPILSNDTTITNYLKINYVYKY